MRDAFRLYRVPVIGLLSGTREEAVCQVFEHVNTGRVSLTVFELVTATLATSNFELRGDWDKRSKQGAPERKLDPIRSHVLLHGVGAKGNRTGKNGVWRTWNPVPGVPLEMS